MDKKSLIGVSLCAVVLLVLGSLSNVVGFQSVKSTTVNDSSLFQTRTQRATNQQQNVLTFQYLGMEKGNLVQFPIKDNKTESLKKVIEFISKMDDKTFARFTELCIQKARQDTILGSANSNKILETLYLLMTEPAIVFNSLLNTNNQHISSQYPNICYLLSWIIFIPILIYCIIMWFLLGCPSTIMPTCNDSVCPG